MHKARFRLSISADRFLAFYSGAARYVAVRAFDGRVIHFPAKILRPFVTHDGVHGDFVLIYDRHNKVVGIEQIR